MKNHYIQIKITLVLIILILLLTHKNFFPSDFCKKKSNSTWHKNIEMNRDITTLGMIWMSISAWKKWMRMRGSCDICEGINEDCQGCNRELCAYKKEIGVKLIHTSHPCTSSRCLILDANILLPYVYEKESYMCHDTISKEWKVHNKTAAQNSTAIILICCFSLVVKFSVFCGRGVGKDERCCNDDYLYTIRIQLC